MKISSQDNAIGEALNRIDWDFPQSATPSNTVHSLHWFPGNFIPQIPAFLIQLLSRKGDLVCDPFCGSGTTGIEALRLGRRCRQSDINRACIQVTIGKQAAFTGKHVLRTLIRVLEEILLDLKVRPTKASGVAVIYDNELERWLHPVTGEQMRILWEIVKSSSGDGRKVLEMLFSDTLFACASVSGAKTRTGKVRRHHWGWVADNVRPKELVQHDAFDLFRIRLFRAIQILKSEHCASSCANIVVREDARTLNVPDASVDLIVTSPPYLGMIDYTTANRLTYLWMNWPMKEDLDSEIGARRYRTRPTATVDYLKSMTLACGEMARVLKPRGYCAIVIGASRKYPKAADNVIKTMSNELKLMWGPKQRTPSRRRVSVKGGLMPSEFICIFKK